MAKMKYLVIHCTATPEGREVTAADIRHWHCDPPAKGGRGWKQVGYTDLVHLLLESRCNSCYSRIVLYLFADCVLLLEIPYNLYLYFFELLPNISIAAMI